MPVATTPAWDAATRSIVIPPPATGWTKGHRYAIAVVAGALGFGGIAGASAGIAKILFGLFVLVAIVFIVLAVMGAKAIE